MSNEDVRPTTIIGIKRWAKTLTAHSRLRRRAHVISSTSTDKAGQPLKVLFPEAQEVFGTFGGRISIQRSPTRWVEPGFVAVAKAFLDGLP